MKKVINITLGGIVFAVEQDAYETFSVYLEAVKRNLTGSDASEIYIDIETAIAEKFISRKRNEKIAITNTDVEIVIAEMGSPADFSEDNEAEESSESSTSSAEIKKRLYRDSDNLVIAGVASGIANYFSIDPVIVRIIFLTSVLFNGLGILIYIILWIAVPTADTTAKKYAMHGNKVTLKEITDSVKRNIDNIRDDNKNVASGTWGRVRSIFVKVFEVIGIVARTFIYIFRYIVGFVLVVTGALGIAGLVSVYTVILLSDKVFLPQEVQIALDIMTSNTLGIVAMFSSFVMMVIPLNVLVISGASLIARKNYFTVTKTVSLAVVWIVAVILAGTTSVLQVEKVMQEIGLPQMENGSYQIRVDNHSVIIDTNISSVQEEAEPSLEVDSKSEQSDSIE